MTQLLTGQISLLRLVCLLVLPLMMITGVSVAQQGGPPSSIGLEMVAEGFAAPVDLDQPPDDSGRLFVVDQIGTIRIVSTDGELLEEPFLDIQDRLVELNTSYDERGLLGLAFHPDFASNGRFFVYYSAPLRDEAPDDWNHTSHLSEFTVSSDDSNVADSESERILMIVDQPQSNHNAGDIAFGPDGYLYVPLGDGGNRDDEGTGHTEETGNAQDTSNLLGSILRIDVNSGDPYGIPSDNPFVGDDNIPDEIWAYGFRNPWRMSYSEEHNGWFVADLGQDVWEEVSLVTAGNNYGWRIREGNHCFSAEYPEHNPLECASTGAMDEPLQPAIIEYTHQLGIAIIGGYVYQGSELSENFRGTYIFGDWSTSFGQPNGQIIVASPPPADAPDSMWKMQGLQIANTGSGYLDTFLLAFGEDSSNELYALTSETSGPSGDTGAVWRLVSASAVNGSND